MNMLFGFIMLSPLSWQESCPIEAAKIAQNARYAKTLATNSSIIHPSPISKKRSNNRIYKMTENKNGKISTRLASIPPQSKPACNISFP